MSQLYTLKKYFWKYRLRLSLGIIFVILTNYFRILSPQISGYVIDIVVHKIDHNASSLNHNYSSYNFFVRWLIEKFNEVSFNEKIFFAGIVLIGTAIVSGFFMFLMRQTIIVMSRLIEFDQKNEIFAHYQSLDMTFYKRQNTGDLMNRISEDVSRVRMFTGPAIMYFINLAAVIGFSIYFMLRSDVKLTIVALCPLPILAITIFFVNTIINKKSEKIQTLLSDLTTSAQETYSGMRVIKSFVQENNMLNFFSAKSNEYRDSALSLAKTEAIYFPSMALMIGLSTLITIMVGALDVINNVPGASVGKIAEFVLYIQMLTFPVSAIGWTASITQRAITSQRRINEFIFQKSSRVNSEMPVNIEVVGNINFSDVNFIYPDTGIHALKSFNLKIKRGEKIAIVGKTGSGKSTIAQLMLRMYDINDGVLKFENIDVKKLELKNFCSQISYVPQDVFLFSDTILNNIKFGRENATNEEVYAAAKSASIYNEIMSFKDGFNTRVGERGVTLSGGQKQRISIARAMIKEPKLVIFDDCLSAVDARTEKQILTNISNYLGNKTAVIITHRIFSLLQFDKIVVLDNGKIVEQGSHEDLLAIDGVYANMYRLQQETTAEYNF